MPAHQPPSRRLFLAFTAAGLVGTSALAACSSTESAPEPSGRPGQARVLLVYFSRAGENYHYGGRRTLEVGNTEVVAGMVRDLIACDVHRIEAADPYPTGYDETVARNVREQNADARPAIANPLPSIDQYDVLLLGSPIWNVRPPMIMATFTDGHDFSGKTVYPFTTHAMSGLGRAVDDYTANCPGSTIGEGLAIQGETVQSARPQVEAWLRRTGLLSE
ncbi:flavodoxin [Kribbella sp. NPDC049174]|uniref:flavodoxin n=1 Tax=Kribbella sp. NPDC049174 TaxID=3364112 RepID=UPI003713C415